MTSIDSLTTKPLQENTLASAPKKLTGAPPLRLVSSLQSLCLDLLCKKYSDTERAPIRELGGIGTHLKVKEEKNKFEEYFGFCFSNVSPSQDPTWKYKAQLLPQLVKTRKQFDSIIVSDDDVADKVIALSTVIKEMNQLRQIVGTTQQFEELFSKHTKKCSQAMDLRTKLTKIVLNHELSLNDKLKNAINVLSKMKQLNGNVKGGVNTQSISGDCYCDLLLADRRPDILPQEECKRVTTH